MNCEGLFHFIFKNTAATQTNLNKLATQKINRIVFTTTGKAELTIIVKPEMQDPLMQNIQCLVDEAKKLIKQ
jgi:catabolite regulation protein CreA